MHIEWWNEPKMPEDERALEGEQYVFKKPMEH